MPRRRVRRRGLRALFSDGEIKRKSGSLPDFGCQIDESIVASNDSINDCKPKSRALSQLFRRIKRLKDAAAHGGLYAGACIHDVDTDVVNTFRLTESLLNLSAARCRGPE